MKTILMIFIVCLNFCSQFTFAGTGEFNDIWLLTRDHILDGVLDPTKKRDEVELAMKLNSHHNKLTGEYSEINNDSVFTGETHTARGTTLIVLYQYGRKFYAIHTGHKLDNNRYVGTWFASGNLSGEFELKKK